MIRHADIGKDLRNLKRFLTAVDSLEARERLFIAKGLQETPGIDQYAGFGNSRVFKARVVALRENVGKAKGYRLVFRLRPDHSCQILAFSRHGIYKSEQELMDIVRTRLASS